MCDQGFDLPRVARLSAARVLWPTAANLVLPNLRVMEAGSRPNTPVNDVQISSRGVGCAVVCGDDRCRRRRRSSSSGCGCAGRGNGQADDFGKAARLRGCWSARARRRRPNARTRPNIEVQWRPPLERQEWRNAARYLSRKRSGDRCGARQAQSGPPCWRAVPSLRRAAVFDIGLRSGKNMQTYLHTREQPSTEFVLRLT